MQERHTVAVRQVLEQGLAATGHFGSVECKFYSGNPVLDGQPAWNQVQPSEPFVSCHARLVTDSFLTADGEEFTTGNLHFCVYFDSRTGEPEYVTVWDVPGWEQVVREVVLPAFPHLQVRLVQDW